MAELAIKGGKAVRTAPFPAWPMSDDDDRGRLLEVLESGRWSFDGPQEALFEQEFADFHGAAGTVTATNGTVTLLLALRALGIGPGDEVLVPSLTWIATATCVLEAQAQPVFVDIDPNTLCMDPAAAERAITPRTAAMIPVHLYTSMADMDALGQLAAKHKLAIIEDCAHAHGARWRDRGAGTIGDLGSFSFQESKVMTAGEGGALISSNKELLDRVYSLKNCGRRSEQRGTKILGGNHRMTEWQSAILRGQLARLPAQQQKRNQAIDKLRDRIDGLFGLRAIAAQDEVTQRPCYRLAIHFDREQAGGIPMHSFLEAVRAEGIPVEATYGPVYKNALYQPDTLKGIPAVTTPVSCPVAEFMAFEKVFVLPHYVLLGDDKDLDDVVTAFDKVLTHPKEAADLVARSKYQVKSFVRKLGPVSGGWYQQ